MSHILRHSFVNVVPTLNEIMQKLVTTIQSLYKNKFSDRYTNLRAKPCATSIQICHQLPE